MTPTENECRIQGHDWRSPDTGKPIRFDSMFDTSSHATIRYPLDAKCERCGTTVHINKQGDRSYTFPEGYVGGGAE